MARTGKKFNSPRPRAPPEAASDSKRTVDDLFQFLTRVRDFRPAKAIDRILKALRRDRLQINYHIRGGTRKGTLEELREREATGAPLNHLLETAPPEGITGPVHFQLWGKLLNLTVRDECLIVEPNCVHDYPWGAYSFTIANWSLVEELWPNPNRAGSAPASENSHAAADEEPVKRSVKPWIKYAIEQQCDQFVDLGPEPAAKLLVGWMKAETLSARKGRGLEAD